jgi:hypothetical protein
VLVWLFIIASAIVVAMVLFDSMDETVMPFACPACHHDAGRLPWYRTVDREGRVRCANCGAMFKEHPDGSLVRDRD